MKEIIDQMMNEFDYATFKRKTTNHVQNTHLQPHWETLCEQLTGFEFDETEQFMLAKAAFCCMANPYEPQEMAQFLILLNQLHTLDGSWLFSQLLTLPGNHEHATFANYSSVCRFIIELYDTPDLFNHVDGSFENINEMRETLQEAHHQYMTQKYPQRSVDELVKHFQTKSLLVEFPLSFDELQEVKSLYVTQQTHQQTLRDLPLSVLKQKATDCGKHLHERKDHGAKCELIAIIALLVERLYKIKPHDTQLFSLLILLNKPEALRGRIGQIKTGQGKSLIIAMLAAFEACFGQFVDVITTTDYLAMRDAHKFTPLFEALGLTCSFINKDSSAPDFKSQVLYGTNLAFEFAWLREGLFCQEKRLSLRDGQLQQRTFDVAIVDEADSLFLEGARSPAIIAIPDTTDFTWIYSPMLNFVKSCGSSLSIDSRTVTDLRHTLKPLLNSQQNAFLDECPDDKLNTWLCNAYAALYRAQEKKDYVVRQIFNKETQECQGEIVIVDAANTGRYSEGSQWQDGLHQFLQAKHNLPIEPEALTAASITHPQYFNLYRCILGMTGTLGLEVERREIEALYQCSSVDIPPHHPCKREYLSDSISLTSKAHYEALLQTIKHMKSLGRPVLVLFKTIEESEHFSKFLVTQGIANQLINENQREKEDYLIARAGEAGMVTIATNTAGRGADILLSPQAKSAGGLHVIITYVPDNTRVEEQGKGRTSRQDAPGSCNKQLCLLDESISTLMPAPIYTQFSELVSKISSDEEIMPCMRFIHFWRDTSVTQLSKHRIEQTRKEAPMFSIQQQFFQKLKSLEQMFNDEFKQELITLCQSAHVTSNNPTSLLAQTAAKLLQAQTNGLKIDWTHFIEQFKLDCIKNFQQEWARFYKQAHEKKITTPTQPDFFNQMNDEAFIVQQLDMLLGNDTQETKQKVFIKP